MLERLRRWAQRAGNTPCVGYACVYRGMPFRYTVNLPSSRTVIPGVVCVHLGDGTRRLATGGNDINGADGWRIQSDEVAA